MSTILLIILVLLLVGALADVALQQRLGLLPERRSGLGSRHRAGAGADGPRMMKRFETAPVRQFAFPR